MDTAPPPLTRDQIFMVFQQVLAQVDTLAGLRLITAQHLDHGLLLGAQALLVCAQTLDMAGDLEGASAFRAKAAWLVEGQAGGRTAQDLFDLPTTARRIAAERLPSFFQTLHS